MFSTEIQALPRAAPTQKSWQQIAVTCKRPIISLREAKVKKNERPRPYGDSR
jgi:hypothetical protein